MRAPSADYSSLRRAVSRQTQAKQNALLGDTLSNLKERQDLNTEGFRIQDKSLDLQGKSLKNQEAQLARQKTWNWVNMGIGLAKEALSFTGKMYDIYAQKQSDLAAAKGVDIAANADVEVKKASVSANGGIDIPELADGTPDFDHAKLDPSINQWFDDQITAVNNDPQLGKAAKQKLVTNIESMRTQTFSSLMIQKIGNDAASLDIIEDDLLKTAVRTDIGASADIRATTGDYAAADAYIASNKNWTAAQKQVKMLDAHKAIDLGRAQNDIQNIAINQGLEAALGKAREYQSMYNWAPDSKEYLGLQSIAKNEDSIRTTEVIGSASAAMTNGLQAMSNGDISITPEGIYDSIRESLKGQSQTRVNAAISAAQAAHKAWATELTSKLTSDMTTATRDELLIEQATLETLNEQGAFSGGAESVYNSAQKNVETYIKAWDSYYGSAETADKQQIANRVAQTKASVDTISNLAINGEISGESAVLQLKSFLAEENNIAGSYEDDAYIEKMIKGIEDKVVPEQYKGTIDSWLDKFGVDVAKALGYPVNKDLTSTSGRLSGLSSAQMASVEKAKDAAYASIINLCRQTAGKDMTPALLEKKLTSISDMYTAETFKALSSGVDEATFFKGSNPEKALNAMANNSGIVWYDSKTGSYRWMNDSFEETYNQVSDWAAQDIENKGIVLDRGAKAEPYKDGKGNVYPFPVFKTADGKDVLYSDSGVYILGEDGMKTVDMKSTEKGGATTSAQDLAGNSAEAALRKMGIDTEAPKKQLKIDENVQKAADNVRRTGTEEAKKELEEAVAKAKAAGTSKMSKQEMEHALAVLATDKYRTADEDVRVLLENGGASIPGFGFEKEEDALDAAQSADIPEGIALKVSGTQVDIVTTQSAEEDTEENWIQRITHGIKRAFNGVK